MASPSQVAYNFASTLFLLRDRPEAAEALTACFDDLHKSLEGRGLEIRCDDSGLSVYGTPIGADLPLAEPLRAHLRDRGIGELRFEPDISRDAVAELARVLVDPPGFYRSLHELMGAMDAGVREAVHLAPPVSVTEETSEWSAYDKVAPEVERQAESLQRPSGKHRAISLPTLLAAIEENPDDPRLTERLNEIVRSADDLAGEGDWKGVLRAASVLVQAERDAKEGAYGRAYGIALRRMLPRSTLEQVARLIGTTEHRADALPVLQRLGADATEALLGLLASAERIEERRAYFAALRQMTEGTELLVNMLTHDEWFVVRNVADLCGELRIEAAVPRLARHLSHPDERVRRSVAMALTKIGSASTIEPLRQVLRDPSPAIRLQTLQALDGRKHRALAMSISVLLDEETRPEVLREMFLALGRIGSAEAVQVLVRASEPGGRLFRRKPTNVRLGAIEGLERAGGAAATLALRSLLQDDDPEVRSAAQRAVTALI